MAQTFSWKTNSVSLVVNRLSQKKIYNIKKWLLLHKTWNNFVESNHFQDFIRDKVDGDYGMPKMFWEGHCISDPLPNTKQKLDALIESCSKMIEDRGKRIEQHLLKIRMR